MYMFASATIKLLLHNNTNAQTQTGAVSTLIHFSSDFKLNKQVLFNFCRCQENRWTAPSSDRERKLQTN